jgi:hypothetical protein
MPGFDERSKECLLEVFRFFYEFYLTCPLDLKTFLVGGQS